MLKHRPPLSVDHAPLSIRSTKSTPSFKSIRSKFRAQPCHPLSTIGENKRQTR
ncbi:hypothetical protein GEOBRER4_n3261 [Citrifermentans bremense]|uniref:Uncharacterized protein n=1 Tax=Citrifermentans bremense TaxID=60035 RepID=A0A7R7FSI4_9BACT|nr:hypothetical protein GEOBRER4_n3261 [Citrifermentans bremense]